MPLKKGKSRAVVSQNIRELHQGKTYQRTRRKSGKEKADRQAVAIALEEAGVSRNRRKRKRVGKKK